MVIGPTPPGTGVIAAAFSAHSKTLLTSRVPFAIFQQLDARDGAIRREERGELGLRGVVGELLLVRFVVLGTEAEADEK